MTALRIIDANLNRAREALRVMEEFARFGLDDATLTRAIKETRHDLRSALDSLEHNLARAGTGESARTIDTSSSPSACSSVVSQRDIVGDVGRKVSTSAEYERADAAHVALAAGKRLSEALRVIEEYGKTIDPSFAVKIERIRYRGYELERRLNLTIRARERFADVRLYVILTESLCENEWFATAEAVLAGGVDCLQLREKELPDGELLKRARRLAQLCHSHDALFIMNDRPDIAAVCGADGVHLGQDDMPIDAARRIIPSHCMIGLSTHTIEQVERAAGQVPDYIAVGPMFATSTKPQKHIASPDTLAAARTCTSIPLVAVGGIVEQNAGRVLEAAPCCLCVCSAVISRSDAEQAVAGLRKSISDAGREMS